MSMSIQEYIKWGIVGDVHVLVSQPPTGTYLNLGSGKKLIPGTIPLDLPDWNADLMSVPYKDGSIDGIWMIHMLEHVNQPIRLLKNCQDILKPGGFVNIVVPYYNSNLNAQELDHKHSFSEETFPALFRQKQYYDKNLVDFEWDFDINFNLIIGITERNMCLYVQLIKGV